VAPCSFSVQKCDARPTAAEEPLAQLLVADRFGLWTVCMTVGGDDSCGLMGTECDMLLCHTPNDTSAEEAICWDQVCNAGHLSHGPLNACVRTMVQ
jgi:hypothetical protein